MQKSKLLIVLLASLVAAPAFAGPHEERREERREERHEERREERREIRHEERREMLHRGGREAPPPARIERWEPRRGYTWVGGRWGWDGNRYTWEGGRYERERVGYRWREPRWEVRDGVYMRVEGDWIAAGPTFAPPALRLERWEPRAGHLWVRGRWDWRGNQWAWVGGHYERERPGYVYREPRWEMREGAYVQVGGTWDVTP